MWTFSWTRGLVHNLASIITNYNLYNLQKKIEDNLDYFGLKVLTLTLVLTSLGGFPLAPLLKLLNPFNLKHNLDSLTTQSTLFET